MVGEHLVSDDLSPKTTLARIGTGFDGATIRLAIFKELSDGLPLEQGVLIAVTDLPRSMKVQLKRFHQIGQGFEADTLLPVFESGDVAAIQADHGAELI